MLDSAVIRARSQVTGAKGELMRKILVDHAAALRAKSALDAIIRAASCFVLTGGQVSDYKVVNALMAFQARNPKAILAGRGYKSDSSRQGLLMHVTLRVVPSRKGRKAFQ